MNKNIFFIFSFCFLLFFVSPIAKTQEIAGYVGPESCADCHEKEYKSFMANSSKARSWKSLEKMLPKLKKSEQEECFSCHTTAYGKEGGFKNLKETPHLANLSCEVCHGPGSVHAEYGDPSDIKRTPEIESCTKCHNEERIQNFKFKPMLYHGGH